ncbi:MAG: T9SS type A sorting domain-containing protein [Bacteroidetes bacterium]|nr:T9SS type A sorting domain-containing protein [Bacteroidota bacterium]
MRQCDYITISNCTLIAVDVGSSAVYNFNSADYNTITRCDIRVTGTATIGIEANQGSAGTDLTIERNHMDGVTGSEATYGYYDDQGITNLIFRNNFVSDFLYGVYYDQNRTGVSFYNNSFYCKNYCLYLGPVAAQVAVKNNIFHCYGTTASDYCFFLNSTSNVTSGNINYNLYYNAAAANNLVRWNNTDYTTIASWRLVTNTPDLQGTTGNPNYTSPTGCNLAISAGSPAENVGVTGLVTNDVTAAGTRANPPDMGAFEIGTSLPVELISFTGKKGKNFNELHWITASEINSEYFEVMRSFDGVTFESIGKINAAGKSNSLFNYSFLDYEQFEGTSYYQLKQYDNDGQHETFNIVAINNSSSEFKINALFPNPSSNYVSVNFQSSEAGAHFIYINDAQGKEVFAAMIASLKGENKFQLSTSTFDSGTYFVRIVNPNMQSTNNQLVIQH